MMEIIDKFVVFLMRERCAGCDECEPLLPEQWQKECLCCCEEGFAKWLLEMAEEFKNGRSGDNI